MQLNLAKQAIGEGEILYNTNVQHVIDTEITLPEYCDDVIRIIKCLVCPNIDSVQIAGNRATAQGNVTIRLVYIGENGKINCYEQIVPFSKYCEIKGNSENICIKARVKTDYVNCRAVSSRKANIHASISVSFKEYQKKNEEIVTDIEGGNIQKKKCEVSCVSTVSFAQRTFSMNETAQMNDSNKSASSIINTCASALCTEIKVINNKLLVKGELIVNIIYCCEGEENEIANFLHSMPISQIMELEGVAEGNICSVDLDVISLEVIPREDASNEKRLFDITAKIGADISAEEEKKVAALVDAYSTGGELKLEQKNTDFYSLADSINETFLIRSQQDLSSLNAQKILAFWCTDVIGEPEIRDSTFYLEGTVTAHFIYCDGDNNLGCTEKIMDFEYKKPLKNDFERFKCEPSIKICDKSAACTSSGEVDVKIEIKVICDIYSCETIRIITNAQEEAEEETQKKKSALVIYFAQNGENLWDIARYYKTSVEAIQKENSFDGETVEEKRMLLIPRV